MSFESDVMAAAAAAEAAIDQAMEGGVTDLVKSVLQEAVQTQVYDTYDPSQYERRGERDGGLMDTASMAAEYDRQTKTLTVRSESRDPHTGRLIAPVVESGRGYNWIHSRIARHPFPRPFHAEAQRRVERGLFRQILKTELETQGYTVE